MPETVPPPDLARLSLAEIAVLVAERKLPPVERWDPPHCGDSAMRITADGRWFHEGSAITRPAMVRLFATLLRREPDGGYVLVTPVEKLAITVDDLPFTAVELKSEGEGPDRKLAFRLNTDEVAIAGPAHRLSLGGANSGDDPRPSLGIRNGLDARISRAIYYGLAEIALAKAADPPGLWSDGCFTAFPQD